jgi:hypothetical protein
MSIFGNNNQQGSLQFGGIPIGYGTGVDDNGFRNILGQIGKILLERGIDLASVPMQYIPQLAAAYQQSIQEATPEGQRAAFRNLSDQIFANGANAAQMAQRQAARAGLGLSAQQGIYNGMIQRAGRQSNDLAMNVIGPGSAGRNAQTLGNAIYGAVNNPLMQAGQQYQRARLGLPYQSRGGMTLGSLIGGVASLGGLGGGGGILGGLGKFITPIFGGNRQSGLQSGGDFYGGGGYY